MKKKILQQSILVILCLEIGLNLFSCSNRLMTTDKLSFISIEEEIRLGEDLDFFTISFLNVIRNRSLNHFLTDISTKLADVSYWSELDYKIYIINESDVNHFSLPGGSIYLFRGLLELAETRGQLAAIIAHEMGHLSQRHAVSRLAEKYSYSFAAQEVIGDNPQIASHIIESLYKKDTILDYPKEHEIEADRLAINYLNKAGFHAYELKQLLEIMKNRESLEPEAFQLLQNTHPPLGFRQKKISQRLKHLQISSTVVQDDPTFEAFKSTLKKIPY